jgi:SAM-dependent methyltransferase
MPDQTDAHPPDVPFAIWTSSGTTEHLGGVAATQRLLQRCPIDPGQALLDLGCGTGYTASQAAERYHARVVGADIHRESLEGARDRLRELVLAGRVALVRADAHHLPFRAAAFDVALAESVLVFCNAARVTAEAHRVLRTGGTFALNEFTFLKPPPEDLLDLLVNQLGIRALQEQEWQDVLRTGGFVDVASQTSGFSLREQLASHIRVDGLVGYLRAAVKGLANTRVSGAFLNRRMLRAARRFVPYVGYGLYTARKSAAA